MKRLVTIYCITTMLMVVVVMALSLYAMLMPDAELQQRIQDRAYLVVFQALLALLLREVANT